MTLEIGDASLASFELAWRWAESNAEAWRDWTGRDFAPADSTSAIWKAPPLAEGAEICLRLAAYDRLDGSMKAYCEAHIEPFPASRAVLARLIVAPSARRKGIGTAMLRLVLGQLRKRHVKDVRLLVLRRNRGARCLYASLGFHATSGGTSGEAIEMKVSF